VYKRQTSACERLLPHAENLLASWQLAIQEVGIPKQQNIQLALGGTSNLWDTFLQSLLPKLAANFPELYIRTEINQPQHLVRALLGGRLDVVVVLDAPTNTDIESKNIGCLELIMVSKEAGLVIEEVPSSGYVFVDWGTAFNLQQARLFSEPSAPILHTGQSHIALEFILQHRGAAYLPKSLLEPYLGEGRLFKITDAVEIKRDVHLVYSKGADKLPSVDKLIRYLEELGVAHEEAASNPLKNS